MTARFLTPDRYDGLLSAETQARPDVALLAYRAERAALDLYAETDGDGVREDGSPTIRLHGYDDDPEVCDAALADAIRLTAAVVVEHWAQAPNPHVASERRGGRAVTYRPGGSAGSYLPTSWNDALGPYDNRSVCYRI